MAISASLSSSFAGFLARNRTTTLLLVVLAVSLAGCLAILALDAARVARARAHLSGVARAAALAGAQALCAGGADPAAVRARARGAGAREAFALGPRYRVAIPDSAIDLSPR